MTLHRRILTGLGTTVVLTYLAAATGLIRGEHLVTLALVFAMGPVAIIGSHRLVGTLAPEVDANTLRLCRFFLGAAFLLLTLMVVVQQMIFMQGSDLLAAASDTAAAQTLQVVLQGVNLVQLSMDVAFDIFYCIGVVMLAAALYRHPAFGRIIGLVGMASAMALLTLNLVAFPYIPAESGLVDLGPVTGLWWLLVIGLQIRRNRRGSPPLAAT